MNIRLTLPEPAVAANAYALTAGAARNASLKHLKYYLNSISICESMETSGSGFSNPQGCLTLFDGDHSRFQYDARGDLTALAEEARSATSGFIDVIDPTSRATLAASTEIHEEQARQYNYGIITWAPPVKVEAEVTLNDQSKLYTHDGPTTSALIGQDQYRDYFTLPPTSLTQGPAEEAVILLPNGGNWFKFQNPLSITPSDVTDKKTWVLDLVLNPDGIVKGYQGTGLGTGHIRERDANGAVLRGINLPMLDLAPVPHRESDVVIRESYLGTVNLGDQSFQARIELYSIENDPNRTVYGVDVKSLVVEQSRAIIPELSKISGLESAADGTLTFYSWKHSPIISGFKRGTREGDTTFANLACATHQDRAGAEGGAAFVVETCPSPSLQIQFQLASFRRMDGSIPIAVGGGPDAGVDGGSGR